jgi:hypothetical protein
MSSKGGQIMRSVLLVGLAVALLTVGILMVKNMGADSGGDVSETRTKQAMQRAEDAKDLANQKVQNMQQQIEGTD